MNITMQVQTKYSNKFVATKIKIAIIIVVHKNKK
jgi:hypothetical protein